MHIFVFLDYLCANKVLTMSKLFETSKLPDELYKPLERAIASSAFWEYDNTEDSLDYRRVGGEDVDQTDAAEVLAGALIAFFKEIEYPVIVLIRSPDVELESNQRHILTPEHEHYPRKVAIGGQMGLTDRGRRLLYLDLMAFDDDLDVSKLDFNAIVGDIASVIRHEVIHAGQYDKRAKKEKTSRVAAKQSYLDAGWIVADTKDRKSYLSSPIEIDAYAHQFAEDLLRRYGLEKAKNILRTANKAEDLPVDEQLQEYLGGVATPKAFKNLMGKVYTHLIDLSDRELIEAVIKRLLN